MDEVASKVEEKVKEEISKTAAEQTEDRHLKESAQTKNIVIVSNGVYRRMAKARDIMTQAVGVVSEAAQYKRVSLEDADAYLLEAAKKAIRTTNIKFAVMGWNAMYQTLLERGFLYKEMFLYVKPLAEYFKAYGGVYGETETFIEYYERDAKAKAILKAIQEEEAKKATQGGNENEREESQVGEGPSEQAPTGDGG